MVELWCSPLSSRAIPEVNFSVNKTRVHIASVRKRIERLSGLVVLELFAITKIIPCRSKHKNKLESFSLDTGQTYLKMHCCLIRTVHFSVIRSEILHADGTPNGINHSLREAHAVHLADSRKLTYRVSADSPHVRKYRNTVRYHFY